MSLCLAQPVLAKLNADDLADDCRGGARQTQWDEPNPARMRASTSTGLLWLTGFAKHGAVPFVSICRVAALLTPVEMAMWGKRERERTLYSVTRNDKRRWFILAVLEELFH